MFCPPIPKISPCFPGSTFLQQKVVLHKGQQLRSKYHSVLQNLLLIKSLASKANSIEHRFMNVLVMIYPTEKVHYRQQSREMMHECVDIDVNQCFHLDNQWRE